MSETLELAQQLIQRPSVTPSDEGCQALIAKRLSAIGFSIETLQFEDVTNLWATLGSRGPLFVFAGHTDVVPTGPENSWRYPPFSATVADGFLHGRGAADMKGSIAAMITAAERFLAKSKLNARIGFLITSDEEGIAINGTQKVMKELGARNIKIDYCLVGEPSSSRQLGDTVKIGRRGSLSAKLVVKGTQGHVAYPQLAINPIHKLLPVLAVLTDITWDEGNASFPATSFQISNINAGTGATNVIPGQIEVDFNFRFSTELNAAAIQSRVTQLLGEADLNYQIDWNLSGEPFLTESGRLVEAVATSIQQHCGLDTERSTAGGTSDGRFIAPTGAEVVELGPCNATIHQIDEKITVAELDKLSDVYQGVLQTLAS
ncbi:MAG: succinyl-diaminopimelate desuccinylase [SAR86 cluster bacterium]|uniref:Succinyl-diaminopimelate desuccinylase n=1 Tax=SAR86 cluster bacterium TaxID=2030880 RepID=A0A2A4X0G9_9GAMM|nr:MAG: succinyl-diaminopimelate desuccinylase [SAR86 cluster bacterium]